MFPSLSAQPTNFVPSLGLSALIVIEEPTGMFSLLPEPFEIITFTFFSSLGMDKSNISLSSLSKCLWQIKQSL